MDLLVFTLHAPLHDRTNVSHMDIILHTKWVSHEWHTWVSHAHCMSITWTMQWDHGNHMYTTWISQRTPHGYYMFITCVSHAYHMGFTFYHSVYRNRAISLVNSKMIFPYQTSHIKVLDVYEIVHVIRKLYRTALLPIQLVHLMEQVVVLQSRSFCYALETITSTCYTTRWR